MAFHAFQFKGQDVAETNGVECGLSTVNKVRIYYQLSCCVATADALTPFPSPITTSPPQRIEGGREELKRKEDGGREEGGVRGERSEEGEGRKRSLARSLTLSQEEDGREEGKRKEDGGR